MTASAITLDVVAPTTVGDLVAQVSLDAWLACGYALVLVLVAYGIDGLAKRASRSRQLNSTNGFDYHEDHDAWLCPQDQWLWPQSFDPDHRVMRYRATPSVCNACPVKSTCTTSESGREIATAVDPWPASEAARFHRGIACAVLAIAVIWPLAVALSGARDASLLLLLLTAGLVVVAGLPLLAHLRRTPALFPDGVRVVTLDENVAVRSQLAAAEARKRTRYRSLSKESS